MKRYNFTLAPCSLQDGGHVASAGKAYLIKQCPRSVQDALQKAKNIKKQNQSYVSIAIVIVCYAIICVRSHLLWPRRPTR